jgi:hypothetical protein
VLLDVERAAPAATAQSVRLVVALSETRGSLGHFGGETADRGILSIWVFSI